VPSRLASRLLPVDSEESEDSALTDAHQFVDGMVAADRELTSGHGTQDSLHMRESQSASNGCVFRRVMSLLIKKSHHLSAVRHTGYDRGMVESDAVRQRQSAGSSAGSELLKPGSDSNPRSDPRKRRRWLRDLDSVLGKEIEEAGSLSCAELIELVTELLGARASRETIEEWWEYTYRRSWIEEHGHDRCRLTTLGHADLHAGRQRSAGIDPLVVANGILKWLLPAGALGATILLTARYPRFAFTTLTIAVGVALGLILLSPAVRWFDRILDRQDARRACDWLDDRRVRLVRDAASSTHRATRLYGFGDRTARGSLSR